MLSGYQADRPVSVGELTRSIRAILETSLPFVKVMGEISNLRQPPSGHLYFTLKDEEAQLRAVYFKMQQRFASAILADGQQVLCRGRISVYEARGEYQLIVDSVEEYGAGKLQLQFEALKHKLSQEGLFAPEEKKAIPSFPHRVALVTSPSGAAVHDFLKTAASRYPLFPVLVVPVRVQGRGAAAEICTALRLVEKKGLADVIVLCRGGGSIEDLWEFNDEELARTIHRLSLPVVTGIGHEIDFTIADFVADHRAVTPTAAAEAVIPDKNFLDMLIGRHRAILVRSLRKILSDRDRLLGSVKRLFREPRLLANYLLQLDHLQESHIRSLRHLLQRREKELADLQRQLAAKRPQLTLLSQDQILRSLRRRISTAITFALTRLEDRQARAAVFLQAVSPLSVLKRGYAMVSDMENRIISDAADTAQGQCLQVRLYRGKLKVSVLKKTGG